MCDVCYPHPANQISLALESGRIPVIAKWQERWRYLFLWMRVRRKRKRGCIIDLAHGGGISLWHSPNNLTSDGRQYLLCSQCARWRCSMYMGLSTIKTLETNHTETENISIVGWVALFEILCNPNSALGRLSMSGNSINNEGIDALLNVLDNNVRLRELVLCYNSDVTAWKWVFSLFYSAIPIMHTSMYVVLCMWVSQQQPLTSTRRAI